MKISRLALPIAVGLVLVAGTLAGLANAAGGAYRESILPGASELQDIHLGADGNVWISDYDAGHVWRVDPVTLAYKRYNDLANVLDARPGPGGYVWWLNYSDRWLGRLEIASGQVTTWTLAVDSAQGMAFDEQGRVWVGVYHEPMLIRFDPVSLQRCEFPLINDSGGYLDAHDGAIWYGDEAEGLGRMDTTSNVNTHWSFGLGFGAWSIDANDARGVWFVHDNNGLVGRLDPDLNTITTYTSTLLEAGSNVLARDHSIWFTDFAEQVISLDPASAHGSTKAVTRTVQTISPVCIHAGAGTSSAVSTITGALGFYNGTFTSTIENGMTHYALPAGSNPYGLAEINGEIWFVDLDRGTVTIIESHRVRLPAISR